tara:strand:- start:36 stop:401 length:366 start_codon:yes stop_codon:yes gene_type:complete
MATRGNSIEPRKSGDGRGRLGGRQKGTPNKRSQDAIERLEALKFDPLEEMVRIARSDDSTLELKARMCAELAGYKYPKRKALEVTGNVHQTFEDVLDELERLDIERATAAENSKAAVETRH